MIAGHDAAPPFLSAGRRALCRVIAREYQEGDTSPRLMRRRLRIKTALRASGGTRAADRRQKTRKPEQVAHLRRCRPLR